MYVCPIMIVLHGYGSAGSILTLVESVYIQLYRPLNIRVVLGSVITWSNGDRIPAATDPRLLLDNFEYYLSTISNVYDSIMLIT